MVTITKEMRNQISYMINTEKQRYGVRKNISAKQAWQNAYENWFKTVS